MKKGFTLVELLAVITLLGLLSLIAVPVVDKLIKDSEEELYETQINNIELAAKNWTSENIFSLPENVGEYVDKTICELERQGFLEVDMKNPKTEELFYKDSYVRITKTDYGFEYNYVDSGSSLVCAICVAATEDNKTGVGTVPVTGQYNYGDEYKCDVGDGQTRTFYLLEDGDTTTLKKGDTGSAGIGEVSLIMDRNIGNTVAWCNDKELCSDGEIWSNEVGPLTAQAYLDQQTKKWIVDASLPTAYQLAIAGGDTEWTDSNYTEKILSAPWLYDYLVDTTHPVSDVYGYWTSTRYDDHQAWQMWFNGIISDSGITDDYDSGVRPVITISKNELSN